MANRARDKVIYIRVDEALKKRFDRIKEASGYKGNADFLNYLLDVYDGKRVDGVTLKDIRELLAQAVHEMKKQGVNINQIAYTINISGSVLGYSVSGNQCIFKEDRRPAVEDYREVVMR